MVKVKLIFQSVLRSASCVAGAAGGSGLVVVGVSEKMKMRDSKGARWMGWAMAEAGVEIVESGSIC